jgi:GH24 family phage-related lysozyme (muramidase)
MTIPAEAVRLNKAFEGFHKKLANGDCTAYQTYLGNGKYDIPTCGYGTTKGVKMGMVWTEEYATQRMMEDLQEAAAFVDQYVTVPLNENERGALILFTNNCGPGNLKKLIVPLNKGDRTGTAKAFLLYVKAQGQTLPGLVSRRTRESALFLKPIAAPEEPFMPQTVTASAEPVKPATAATAAGAAAVVATQTLPGLPIPSVPPEIADSVTNVTAWKTVAEHAGAIKTWAVAQPTMALGLSITVAAFYLYSKRGQSQ